MLTINATVSFMPLAKKVFQLEVADRLHSAAIHLLRHARKEDVLSKQGPARLSALSVLVFGGPTSLGELAEVEQVKPSTMSLVVVALKRAGLVTSEVDPGDARKISVAATAKGERLLQQARARRIQLLAKTIGGLTEAEMNTLRRAAGLIEGALRGEAEKN
jgi:DNA-binding MarR family transcriptional regulator